MKIRTVGHSYRRCLLSVSFAERGDRIRIISARELTPAEKGAYEAKAFPDEAAVNEALRLVIRLTEIQRGEKERVAKG